MVRLLVAAHRAEETIAFAASRKGLNFTFASDTAALSNYHVHIEGRVQGVGFRPFVYRLAHAHKVLGWVKNASDGVHIRVGGLDKSAAEAFYRAAIAQAPALSLITSANFWEVEEEIFETFDIVESSKATNGQLLITPDFGLCEDCRKEFLTPENRRFGYPFITCTNCGPRFSVMKSLPYDRPFTSMHPFAMCPECTAEYHDPTDRRYFSQTNSCPQCGISLQLWDTATQSEVAGNQTELLQKVVQAIAQGKTVAVKGIGGFLLLCDATQEQAVMQLRERKNRPKKPFAVMFPNEREVQKELILTEKASAALRSAAAPIVLLTNRQEKGTVCRRAVAPGLDQTGVMLPYAPLFEALMQQLKRPLVATSANLSGSPIFYKNKEAQEGLQQLADFILMHDREIILPQDDSVIRFTEGGQPLMLRRSRGFAPSVPLQDESLLPQKSVLSMGAFMKSSFALAHRKQLYVSQFLGNHESFEAQQTFEGVLHHFLHLRGLSKVDTVLADAHPEYFATQLGERLAQQWGVPFIKIPHHEAHFAAILGEHSQFSSHQTKKILGVIWDGTGLGTDGHSWGGEFFEWEGGAMERVAHLPYFPLLLGDKAAKEPRLVALSLLHQFGLPLEQLRPHFTEREWGLYPKLLHQKQLLTSSMGRLFDGVAALLGLAAINTFEGEAAMRLETVATDFIKQNGTAQLKYWVDPENPNDLLPLLKAIHQAKMEGRPIGLLAACFHFSLVKMVEKIAALRGARTLAFSGGVFQNALLLHLLQTELGQRFELLFHEQMPPNDENIAFGQVICFKKKVVHQNELCENLP